MSNALDDLIAKVEAGDGDEVLSLSYDVAEMTGHRGRYTFVVDAFNGSLDAAKALHEAALPGWTYNDHLRRGLRYTTFIGKSVEDEPVDAVSNDPARSWLLAILRAMKEGGQ